MEHLNTLSNASAPLAVVGLIGASVTTGMLGCLLLAQLADIVKLVRGKLKAARIDAWLAQFDRLWPEGAPAAVSYRRRLTDGTHLVPEGIIFPSFR